MSGSSQQYLGYHMPTKHALKQAQPNLDMISHEVPLTSQMYSNLMEITWFNHFIDDQINLYSGNLMPHKLTSIMVMINMYLDNLVSYKLTFSMTISIFLYYKDSLLINHQGKKLIGLN
jgi:hypothetical protein